VLSDRGLCGELIIRPEESCRLWCVVVCDLENLKNEEAMTGVGSQRHRKELLPLKRNVVLYFFIFMYVPCIMHSVVKCSWVQCGEV